MTLTKMFVHGTTLPALVQSLVCGVTGLWGRWSVGELVCGALISGELFSGWSVEGRSVEISSIELLC